MRRRIPGGYRRARRKYLLPPHLLLASFAAAIAIGTVVLMMPFSWEAGIQVNPIDALFTATSAICVTGLTAVDTGATYSRIGEIAILIMLQMGGLGVMTIGTFFALALGRRIAFRERSVVTSMFCSDTIPDVRSLLKYIVITTVAIESVGAVLLSVRFAADYPVGRAAYLGLFHSISAFCNAGFSPFSDSFQGYRNDIVVNLTLVSLIVTGGLGFLVLMDIKRKWIDMRRVDFQSLTLHSKLVLAVSLTLLVFGAVGIAVMETGNVPDDVPWQTRVLTPLFLSVTSRTAGFNTVRTSNLTDGTLLLICLMMFIGASPGSTGGGIKTTTAGVIVAAALSRLRGQRSVNVFYRTVPSRVVDRSVSLLVGAICLVVVVVLVLQLTENAGVRHGAFLRLTFEAVSAFGTVGLSTGVTPDLSFLGKLLIMVLMFVGRLGPVTVAMAIATREQPPAYSYAEEGVMIG